MSAAPQSLCWSLSKTTSERRSRVFTLARHARFHVHFTPTSASWINQVERFFATLTQRQIRRGTHRSTVQLERAIKTYLNAHNRDPRPFVWTKTADQILHSLKRFCMRTSNSRH